METDIKVNNSLTLPSPAKLNLFLHITGKRADGYHNLQTLFQLLDYGDEITFQKNSTNTISVSPQIDGLPQEQNLIYKAATKLQEVTQTQLGANILLKKVLPMGGGIGGGSSNAATTLVALNYLWQTGLTLEELAPIGRQLGADVPIFINGRTSWAEGIGDKLTPIETTNQWFLVLIPDCHVSTAKIFSHKDLTRDTRAIKVAAFLERGGTNDCQKLVESLYPQVRDAVAWLSEFSNAQMTGTGACVFAPFSDKKAAEAVLAKRPKQFKGFVAKGVNQSPLHQHLPD